MSERSIEQINTDERLESLERRMDDVEQWQKDAVPTGDHVGHRRYHELIIENTAAKKRLTQAVLEKSIAGLVWAALFGIGVALWQWVKQQLRAG